MSKPIELTTEEPQRDKKHIWTLYWSHATDLDANYRADEGTLRKAGYVPAAALQAAEAEAARLKAQVEALGPGLEELTRWYRESKSQLSALQADHAHLVEAAELLRWIATDAQVTCTGELNRAIDEWDERDQSRQSAQPSPSGGAMAEGKDSSPSGQKEGSDERDSARGLRRIRGLRGVEELRGAPDAEVARAAGEDSGGLESGGSSGAAVNAAPFGGRGASAVGRGPDGSAPGLRQGAVSSEEAMRPVQPARDPSAHTGSASRLCEAEALAGSTPAKEPAKGGEQCHKCGEPANINDGDDGMGPPVCCDCYDAEWQPSPPVAEPSAAGGFRVGQRVWPSMTAPRHVYNGTDGGEVISVGGKDPDPLPYRVRWSNGSDCNYAQHELTTVPPTNPVAEPGRDNPLQLASELLDVALGGPTIDPSALAAAVGYILDHLKALEKRE